MIKRKKYIFFCMLIILFIAFSSNANNYIKKWKTLTQVIRLVNENYVEEVDMNEIRIEIEEPERMSHLAIQN